MTRHHRPARRLLVGTVLAVALSSACGTTDPEVTAGDPEPASVGSASASFDWQCWPLDGQPASSGPAQLGEITQGVLCVSDLTNPTQDPEPVELDADQLAVLQESGDSSEAPDEPCRNQQLLVTLYGINDAGEPGDYRLPLCAADVVVCEDSGTTCGDNGRHGWVLTENARTMVEKLLTDAGYQL